MKKFGGWMLLCVMMGTVGSCKKKIAEERVDMLPVDLSGSRSSIAALTKEVARALEDVYRDDKTCREVNAAILSGYYEDERVLLNDLLVPSSSGVYKNEIFRQTKTDTGIFRKQFCQIIQKGNYPLILSEFKSALSFNGVVVPVKTRSDAHLPDDLETTTSGNQEVSIYFPYSENFESALKDSLPPKGKIAIMMKPTIVYTDRDADLAPGRDPYQCSGSPGNICYRDILVDDNYAEGKMTHIVGIGAIVKAASAVVVPKNDLVTRIYTGGTKLSRQMDKLVSFTGNGGGSEIKICRVNGYLRRTDEHVTDFTGDVSTLNFTRADIRKKRWKRAYNVWDPNWNYQDIEQIYAVYEDDNMGSATIDGSLTTNLTLPSKLGKVEGNIGFKIQVKTQDEIILQRKLDRKSFLRDGLNNQGWGFYADNDDFLAGTKDWPVFDGGSVWQFTLPYRIY